MLRNLIYFILNHYINIYIIKKNISYLQYAYIISVDIKMRKNFLIHIL
jgi:hypothetical protein